MCGRIVCQLSLDTLASALDATPQAHADPIYQPSYNIPPSQPLPIVFATRKQNNEGRSPRTLALARWGLLPHWAKDESLSFKTFNARAETVHEKPSFRGAFKYRRGLIPIDGYYEWQRQGKTKLPYYFHRTDGQPLVLAGLFELWREELLTCTVITTAANTLAQSVHHRMPVVLEPEQWTTWLEGPPDGARSLLKPAPDAVLTTYRVDTRVNSVKNDDKQLMDCLAIEHSND